MTEQNYDLMRQAMVSSQLRTTGVNDGRVLAAMTAVPRHRYVPADQASLAYKDTAVPLADGRALPAAAVLGRLLTEARVRPTDHALVIGSSSGYAAAVLAALVARVTALEEDGGIAAGPLPANVAAVSGPLGEGWAANAPYDVILFDGAVDEVPGGIVDQLAEGGVLAVPLWRGGLSSLSIGRKAGGFGLTGIVDAAAPRLPGFIRPATFSF